MPRALWRGAISFSLVHIPVTLAAAARSKTLDLDLLDKHDFAPVGYQRVNKATGKVVEWSQIVKGYQYEKGEYVVLSDEDFRRANVKATQEIDIHAFVDRDAILPSYFDTPYHVLPEKRAGKVYGLLREALERSGKVAIASFVLRTRQSMAALLPVDDAILLNTLRFHDEMVDVPAKAIPGGKSATPASRELKMALKLIEEMSEPWKPQKYHDTYRDDLLKRIDEKVKAGKTKTLTPASRSGAARGGGKVVDLMALLSKSLEESKGGASESPASASTKSRRRRVPRRSTRGRTARRA
jgi:DNA end-binding protein Ku